MGVALQTIGEVNLDVVMLERAPGVELAQRITGCVLLENMALKDVAEFRPPQVSWTGDPDAYGLEIAAVGPKLAEWGEARKAEGGCCLQSLQVGDRIISINSSTVVRENLDKE